MTSKYQKILDDYYREKHFHPESFNCLQQNYCRQYANQGDMTETKMSMVGSLYGEKYPKIVVVSLDPPSGKDKDKKIKNIRWEFTLPHQRTTAYVSSTHEKDDYWMVRPNPHWAMTQVIVKDLLLLWGYPVKPGAAFVPDRFPGLLIENVSAYFAHVNVAKCSMNNKGQRQADDEVHLACSKAYLLDELNLLEPDILITQGLETNKILGKMLVGREILIKDLPVNQRIPLGNNSVLWLPMRHPSQQYKQIRDLWPAYLHSAKLWAKK